MILLPLYNSTSDVTVAIVSTDGKPVTFGDNHTLLCNVSSSINMQQDLTYKWWHFDGTDRKEIKDSNSNMLTLPPVKLKNAGEYTCEVEIGSTEVSSSVKIPTKSPYTLILSGKSKNELNLWISKNYFIFSTSPNRQHHHS